MRKFIVLLALFAVLGCYAEEQKTRVVDTDAAARKPFPLGVWEIQFSGIDYAAKFSELCDFPKQLYAAESQSSVLSEISIRTLPRSSGEYMGHKWYIDENHLMWWDGKPYVPFGGFGINPGNQFGLNTYNLWIDSDPFICNTEYTRTQHKYDIAQRLKQISDSGGTCIVQFSMAGPHTPEGFRPGMQWKEPEGGIDASSLADPEVKQAIFRVWAEYAASVRNECVRAIVLWNEINVWRWPDRLTVDEYAKLLGEYVREVKRLVGDVPVLFKTASTWRAEVVIAGAAIADGLAFDIWFSNPDDTYAKREIKRALDMLVSRQTKTTWFFIAEGGRTLREDKPVDKYWDRWPPFRSREEAADILGAYARAGAKGFIYNGISSDVKSRYHESYRWIGELQPAIVRLMVQITIPANSE